MTELKELSKAIYANNVTKGFWDGGIEVKNIGEVLMLTVTEVSEACEADRNNRHADVFMDRHASNLDVGNPTEVLLFQREFKEKVKDTFEDEMADIIIRVLDVCGAMDIDIDWHIQQKRLFNSLRPYKHNKAY